MLACPSERLLILGASLGRATREFLDGRKRRALRSLDEWSEEATVARRLSGRGMSGYAAFAAAQASVDVFVFVGCRGDVRVVVAGGDLVAVVVRCGEHLLEDGSLSLVHAALCQPRADALKRAIQVFADLCRCLLALAEYARGPHDAPLEALDGQGGFGRPAHRPIEVPM